MKVFKDYAGRAVRLTPEREAHILDHPEMLDLLEEIQEAISVPEKWFAVRPTTLWSFITASSERQKSATSVFAW